jgi:uncharacterized Zn finger protein
VAIIEVSEEGLRRAARGDVYARAVELVDAGKVGDLRAGGTVLSAIVGGIPVSVRILAGGIEGRCECVTSTGDLCVHAVAAALAWVREGQDEDAPDLYGVLRLQSRDWLASRLADLAAGDPALTALLLAEAAEAESFEAVAGLRDELDEVLDELEEDAAEQGEYAEWYPDCEALDEMIEDAGEFVDDAPDDIRELADHVIMRIEGLLDYQNCFGSDLTGALEQAQELHWQACRAGSPDVSRLAERLVTGALESGWGVFTDGIAKYADVLGPAGLARCRELLARQTGERHGLGELRDSLARAENARAGGVLAEEAGNES